MRLSTATNACCEQDVMSNQRAVGLDSNPVGCLEQEQRQAHHEQWCCMLPPAFEATLLR